MKAGCLVAATLLCTSGAAVASVVASDAFTYADGALAGSNGGAGWSGAWTGGGPVASGAAAFTGNSSGFRNLSSAIVPTAGESLFLGMRLGAEPSSLAMAGLALVALPGAARRRSAH